MRNIEEKIFSFGELVYMPCAKCAAVLSDPEPSGLDSKAEERKAFIRKGDSSKIYFIKLFPARVL